MADAVQVFPPGYRLTDSATGAPLSGSVLAFFDAGTTNPKIVYSDNALSIALGTTVTCDALGCPTSDGTTKTHVYVGTADYKIIIKSSALVTIETKDNIKGAVVSSAGAGVTAIATRPVVTKSINYSVLSGDQSTVFVGNCSAGDVTFTLPSAVTVANGWLITIQHAGTANQCIAATISSQTITDGPKSFGGFYPLTFNGEEATFVSDGGNWRIAAHTNPFIKGTVGIIPIVSRLATSPASPVQGDMYILTGTGGSWAAFAIGDVALYTGGNAALASGWVNFTPPSNIGWYAYVQAETVYYRYRTAVWVSEIATTSSNGITLLADTAAMKAKTATRVVTADLQQYQPAHPKAWGMLNGGTGTLLASSGVSSMAKIGTGNYTFALSTAMASANYALVVTGCSSASSSSATSVVVASATDVSAGAFRILTSDNNTDTLVDAVVCSFVILGDQ